VEEAHRRGIKVILDGVFNHCGSFNKWMDRERIYENAPGYEKGAFISEDSPYHDFFSFHKDGGWPYNSAYDGWWGHDTLPKLNYEGSRQLFDYILYIGRKWVSPPYNADGWRLDVAADLGHSSAFNHQFWQEFRHAVKQANPNAIILAEHYGNTRDWLQGNEWDTVMNYDAFMEPVTWFLTGMEKHSDDFREDLLGNAESFWGAMKHHSASFSMPSWQVAMNQLSNHDHSRFLTRTNHKVGRTNTLGPQAAEQDVKVPVFREAVVIQMTWIGAPTLYYGDEAGVCGFTDPDSRRTYPWGREDQELIRFHKDIIRIRKENPEFRRGSLKQLDYDYNYLAYARFTRKEQSIILVNNNNSSLRREVVVWEAGTAKTGKLRLLLQTDNRGYHMEEREYVMQNGKILIDLPPVSATILKYVKE
jgi:alpha-glucosidase